MPLHSLRKAANMEITKARIPVIIDTDPGVDDIIAILLALASPELDILAFIISYGKSLRQLTISSLLTLSSGNTDLDASYLNILKLYQAIDRHLQKHPEDVIRFPNFAPQRRVILTRGCDRPCEGKSHNAQYFHGRDGLGNITERHPDLNVEGPTTQQHPQLHISPTHGVEVALDILRSHPPRSVTYIVLGPMTNLLHMMRKDGDMIRERIGRVVIMGGALDVPGNTTPVAEFNFYADPYAVKELLLSPNEKLHLPLNRVNLCTLDLTTTHELPFPVYQRSIDSAFKSLLAPSDGITKSPLAHFTSSVLESTREIMLSFGKDAMELHDIVAVWCAIENPPLPDNQDIEKALSPGWHTLRRKFDVERTGELTRGMLVVDRREGETAYAPGANRAEIQRLLDQSNFPHKQWESVAVPAQVEVEHEPKILPPSSTHEGILCITGTPGPKALLQLLLRRVWGAKVDE
ncbi:hypothetical protein Agabi119p4_2428 [Agaricus bisporus var. burnettii]|uniref:Inosine/uridine-preferring nucleoside hydrolase domain-containing protein n=1 Tax=Agaricus bisporus var. burnettii TaxID=192524 RepID=A0A8H7F972_AGABI|nr:hypothetical protein Agabi119p4_2428 [Agaricus bisporus var. burnettii]